MPEYEDIREAIQENEQDREDKLQVAVVGALDRFNKDHQVFFQDGLAYDGVAYNEVLKNAPSQWTQTEKHEDGLEISHINHLEFSAESRLDENGHYQFTVGINDGDDGIEIVPKEEPEVAACLLSGQPVDRATLNQGDIVALMLYWHHENQAEARVAAYLRDIDPEDIAAPDLIPGLHTPEEATAIQYGIGPRKGGPFLTEDQDGQPIDRARVPSELDANDAKGFKQALEERPVEAIHAGANGYANWREIARGEDQEKVQQAQANQSADRSSGRRPGARRDSGQEAGQSL